MEVKSKRNRLQVKWTEEEDEVLQQIMQQFPVIKWNKAAKRINQKYHDSRKVRDSKQCRQRWTEKLLPIKELNWQNNDLQEFNQIFNDQPHLKGHELWKIFEQKFAQYNIEALKLLWKRKIETFKPKIQNTNQSQKQENQICQKF